MIMITTDKPNDMVGISYTTNPDVPKALVTAEAVVNKQSVAELLYGLNTLAISLDDFIYRIGKRYRGREYDALLVVVDDRGHFSVYDSLTQRGGRGLKKQVELHRLKLFTALLRALPGLCTDLLSFLSSQIDDEPHPTQMPLELITTKAAYKLIPDWLKKLYSECQTIQV